MGLQNWARTMPNNVHAGVAIACHGSPEGVIPAPVGKICIDADTGDLYQKERSGGMEVGWVKRGLGEISNGSSVISGLRFMTTAARDAWTPTTTYAAVILTDSVPPWQVSIWANGRWN